MIAPSYGLTATERVLPRMMLDFTTAVTDARVATSRAGNTATRINSSGQIELVNANLPRYNFNPTSLICTGQLIEQARTNLLLNSLIDGTNLTTQSVVLTATGYTLSFYGAGSIVISGGHSATVSGTGAYPVRTTYTFTPTAGSSTFTVSGTVQYAQLEEGSFATSFIPTAATSVLRNADNVSLSGTSFSSWYNVSAGTIYVEFDVAATTAGGGAVISMLTDGGGNGYGFYKGSVSAGLSTIVGSNFSALGNMTVNTIQKAVLGYDAVNIRSILGTNGLATTVTAAIGTPNTLYLGRNWYAGDFMSGHMRKVKYWPQKLTDAELAANTY